MKVMAASENINLERFREELYNTFAYRADALMDLLDALASNTNARTVVELSLNPLFRRQYSSLFDGLDNFLGPDAKNPLAARRAKELEILRLVAAFLPTPAKRAFWLFGLDATTVPRPFAATLPDRGYQYQPNTLRGNKPVTIGHSVSTLAFLPEKEKESPPWVVPMVIRRITSSESEVGVAFEIMKMMLNDDGLPFSGQLVVTIADSKYNCVQFIGPQAEIENLVTITRCRANRVFYRQPTPPPEGTRKRGHPRWYGERFDLKDNSTWGSPTEAIQIPHTSLSSRKYTIVIEGWDDLLMRGKRDIPMHRHPFRLIRIRWLTPEGTALFAKDMWLVVMGQRRGELSLSDICHSYRQRYDLEHFFRFGKQRLLLDKFQTPDEQREESFMQIVGIAYVQLFLARELVTTLPRPWERYLPQATSGIANPSQAQRDMERIIGQIGTPAKPPKVRGKSAGRSKGNTLDKRKRPPVVKKGKKKRQKREKLPKAA